MGLLKDIVLPAVGVEFPGRKKKDDESAKRKSSGGGYIGDEAAAGNYKRGGKVKRTGLARVHKGERVLTRAQAKRYKRRGGSKR